MNEEKTKDRVRKQKRAKRVRKKLRGTSAKPRLCVVKTNKHIYAQLIDDSKGVTIGSASTLSKNVEIKKKNKESAKKLGEAIGAIAKDKKFKELVFDRGPYKYHGILAELANSVREQGISF